MNVADFLKNFLTPLKTDKILAFGTDNLNNDLSEEDEEIIEDHENDSFICTVEESNLNCPEEEMLDLTITDEFKEDCHR